MGSSRAVDPQVKRDLQAKLADAEQNLAEANREEQTLSEQDKEIRAEHRFYKESFVSTLTGIRI